MTRDQIIADLLAHVAGSISGDTTALTQDRISLG
jgi:hypothetical protein